MDPLTPADTYTIWNSIWCVKEGNVLNMHSWSDIKAWNAHVIHLGWWLREQLIPQFMHYAVFGIICTVSRSDTSDFIAFFSFSVDAPWKEKTSFKVYCYTLCSLCRVRYLCYCNLPFTTTLSQIYKLQLVSTFPLIIQYSGIRYLTKENPIVFTIDWICGHNTHVIRQLKKFNNLWETILNWLET